jgi:hypothetical protein
MSATKRLLMCSCEGRSLGRISTAPETRRSGLRRSTIAEGTA